MCISVTAFGKYSQPPVKNRHFLYFYGSTYSIQYINRIIKQYFVKYSSFFYKQRKFITIAAKQYQARVYPAVKLQLLNSCAGYFAMDIWIYRQVRKHRHAQPSDTIKKSFGGINHHFMIIIQMEINFSFALKILCFVRSFSVEFK